MKNDENAVIYEIEAEIDAELITQYEKYMREEHIPDLMKTGYFARAVFSRSLDGSYRIEYFARNQAALDEYLAKDAPRLRQHFNSAFPTGVKVSRENRKVLESWNDS